MNTLLTRKEAAARLGVTVMTLDAERSSGHLAYIQRKPGGKVWITEEAIAEYPCSRNAPGTTGAAACEVTRCTRLKIEERRIPLCQRIF